MRLKKINDTTLVAPHRGRPPVAPDGYEADPGDPFMFHIKLPVCVDREERIERRPCCTKIISWCKFANVPTTRFACVNRCPKQQS